MDSLISNIPDPPEKIKSANYYTPACMECVCQLKLSLQKTISVKW